MCSAGYYLINNGSCLPGVPNCEYCLNQTICLWCDVGYGLSSDNTSCLQCMDSCIYCVSNDNGSLSCILPFAYYGLENGVPVPCPNNCIGCEIPQVCTLCKASFITTSVNPTDDRF